MQVLCHDMARTLQVGEAQDMARTLQGGAAHGSARLLQGGVGIRLAGGGLQVRVGVWVLDFAKYLKLQANKKGNDLAQLQWHDTCRGVLA